MVILSVLVLVMALALVAGPAQAGSITVAKTKLVAKDANWNPLPIPHGELGYVTEWPVWMGHVKAAGLTGTVMTPWGPLAVRPGDWYLVTLQKSGAANYFAGSDGLFGAKSYGDFSWVDVGLVQTRSDGTVLRALPTTSGLSAADLQVSDLGSGALAPGTYSGVTVAVKWVGRGMTPGGKSIPDLGNLFLGGTGVMFERDALQDFTVTP